MSESQTHSAKDYADALKRAMQQENILDRMKAVKIALDSTDSEALQAIIDSMEDEQFVEFSKLQRLIIDGTFENIKDMQDMQENKDTKDNDSIITTLLENILYMPGPNEFIEKFEEKKEDVKHCFKDFQNTCTQTLVPIYNFATNSFNNIKYFVDTLHKANYISNDIKKYIITKLYYNKGELLVSYRDGELKFENSLDNIASEYIRNESGLNTGKTMSQLKPDVMDDALNKIGDNILKKTQEAPGRIESTKFQNVKSIAIEKANKIYGALIPRSVHKNYLSQITKKRKHEEPPNNEEEPPNKKGGKTRRKIRRNKKAKTKKRKANKKTKKRKTNKKTKINRKKSKKRRNKK